MEGLVLLLAELEPNGNVSKVTVVNEPQMLRASAISFVQGWRVNTYSGPRTCPVAIFYSFSVPGAEMPSTTHRSDPQHVTTYNGSLQIETLMYQQIDSHITLSVRGPMLVRSRRNDYTAETFRHILRCGEIIMRTLSVQEASQDFAGVLAQVENGEQLILERDGRPVATVSGIRQHAVSVEERERRWSEMLSILDKGMPLGGIAPTKDEMHER